jgi:hypothetical protein
MLRIISGTKTDEEAGFWGKQLNEKLHNAYSSPDIKIAMFNGMGEMKNAYKIM